MLAGDVGARASQRRGRSPMAYIGGALASSL